MSVAKLARERKRQLGQFFTPSHIAEAIVNKLTISPEQIILEPSFGNGAFLFPIINKIKAQIGQERLISWSQNNLYSCEIDPHAYNGFRAKCRMANLDGITNNLENCDFFTWMPKGIDRLSATNKRLYFSAPLAVFDLIIGNPPFGGSINPSIQDELDSILGFRNNRKIKKETYAFFIVKCVDLLKDGGKLVFICSDTILTIPTMTGLREWLQQTCSVDISALPSNFDDTNQDMLIISLTKQLNPPRQIIVMGKPIPASEISATPNQSWRIDSELARYFTGISLGDKMIATSGMTIGNNELFLREIHNDTIEEWYDFYLEQELITVDKLLARARLGKVSASKLQAVAEQQKKGDTETVVKYQKRDKPLIIKLPHPDSCYYNKATSEIIYSPPQWVIFWRNQGEYVYTYKKTGNWYLHGVGGKPYFGKQGLTWSLIAPRLLTRYLPAGYILDSGCPCAFLRDGVEPHELYFIIGWTLTDLCKLLLKKVLNHTRNIQSKDFERLPKKRRKALPLRAGM